MTNSAATANRESSQSIWRQALRWVSVLPGAILGSLLAYWLGRFFVWLGSARFGEETWFAYLSKEIIGSALMGCAFVYCAAFIAPHFKRQVALIFAGLLLSLSGVLLLAALQAAQYMSLATTVCLNVGSIATAIAVFNGSLDDYM